MSVAYPARRPDAGHEPVHDEIEIVIPHDGAVFHAAYRTSERQCGRHLRSEGKRPCDAIVISLDRVFFERKAREALGSEAPRLIQRCTAMDPFMREIGNTLRSEFSPRRIPCPTYLESLAAVIAVHLARNYCAGLAAMLPYTGLAAHKLNQVQAFITEHLAEGIRVRQLAEAVHMSVFHFARMFKQATGQPPHLYITLQRMEYAKDLLRNSHLPLVDVAASAGFQTQGHFTGVFRKYTGMTPRIFRLNWRALA